VGAGTASVAAFRAIRAADPNAKILVVSSEGNYPYMRPPLSKELWYKTEEEEKKGGLDFKQWNGRTRSVFIEPPQYYIPTTELQGRAMGGVSVLRGQRVVRVDPSKKVAFLEGGQAIRYEKCLLTPGGSPKSLPVMGEAVRANTTMYRGIADYERLLDVVKAGKHVTIVGGGFLGSELACSISFKGEQTGARVTQVFPESGNMGKVLPEYLCKWSTEKVRAEGVTVKPNCYVRSAGMTEGGRVKLGLNDGSELETDHVVVAVGIQPDVSLAVSSGLEVDDTSGGFRVNAELMARSDLWVAGDAASFYDVRLGRRRVEHHDHAIVSGRLAGENMAGAGKPYWHQSMFWSDLGPDVGYEAIGLADSSLNTVGVFARGCEQDTPKAVVEATGEGVRSETETEATHAALAASAPKASAPATGEGYGKGVVFYLRDDRIVGILLWNVYGRMPLARKILKDSHKYEDLAEVAKLFELGNGPDVETVKD